jgi:hypothetical protein
MPREVIVALVGSGDEEEEVSSHLLSHQHFLRVSRSTFTSITLVCPLFFVKYSIIHRRGYVVSCQR